MSGIAITFRNEIAAFAQAHGLDMSDEAAASLEQTLQATVKVGDDSSVSFITGSGRTGTLDDALQLYSAGMPAKSNESRQTPAPATGKATARALAANAAMREGRSAARFVEAQNLVAEAGNPWEPRSINRTKQGLISNLHPDLAARLKRQAGVRM